MTSVAKALLDQLMGKDRNKSATHSKADAPSSWKSADVCKMYLVDFCPHDLFPNTRADLGKCNRVHSDIFKQRFEQDQSDDKEYLACKYETDYLLYLRRIVDSCDTRIKRARERVQAVPPEIAVSDENRAAIHKLNLEISSIVKEAELLAEQGNLGESTTKMLKVSEINLEIKKLAGEKYLRYVRSEVVCGTCGVLMAAPEDLETCQDHLRGKQHSGFERVRKKIAELELKLKDSSDSKRGSGSTDRRPSDNRRAGDNRTRYDSRHDRRRSRSRQRDRDWSRGRSLSRDRRRRRDSSVSSISDGSVSSISVDSIRGGRR